MVTVATFQNQLFMQIIMIKCAFHRSPKEVASYNGTKIQHYIYSGFGKLLKITNSANADITSSPHLDPYYTFTGREYDKESELYSYRSRVYDSSNGRFLQTDSDPGFSGIPATFLNKHTYAFNNPINNTDPSGKWSWGHLIALVIIAVAAVVNEIVYSTDSEKEVEIGGY